MPVTRHVVHQPWIPLGTVAAPADQAAAVTPATLTVTPVALSALVGDAAAAISPATVTVTPVALSGSAAGGAPAITLDAIATANQAPNTAPATVSFTHVLGTGTARAVVVCAGWETFGSTTATSSATYNGVAMVPVAFDTTFALTARSAIFYLLDSGLPAAGSYTVAVTAGTSAGTIAQMQVACYSLFGVDQMGQPDVAITAPSTTGGASASQAITTLAAGSWVFDVLATNNVTTAATAGGSQTNPQVMGNAGSTGSGFLSSILPTTTAGSQTVSWSSITPAPARWAWCLAAFRPGVSYGTLLGEYHFANPMLITASSGAVSSVAAASGSWLPIAQSNGSYQPTTGTRTSPSGRNVLDFAGDGDHLYVGDKYITQPFTWVAVCASDNPADTTQHDVLSFYASGAAVFVNSDVWQFYAAASVASSTADDTSWHVIVAVFDGTTSKLYRDGTQIATGNTGTGGPDFPSVGAHVLGAQPWDGPIAHSLLFSGIVSDIPALSAALKAIWGTV